MFLPIGLDQKREIFSGFERHTSKIQVFMKFQDEILPLKVFKSLLLTQDQDIFILYGRAFQDNEPKIREDLSKSVLR